MAWSLANPFTVLTSPTDLIILPVRIWFIWFTSVRSGETCVALCTCCEGILYRLQPICWMHIYSPICHHPCSSYPISPCHPTISPHPMLSIPTLAFQSSIRIVKFFPGHSAMIDSIIFVKMTFIVYTAVIGRRIILDNTHYYSLLCFDDALTIQGLWVSHPITAFRVSLNSIKAIQRVCESFFPSRPEYSSIYPKSYLPCLALV